MPEFMVHMSVQGRMTMTIDADNKAAVEEKLIALVNDDNWEADLEDVDDVNWHIAELIPIVRDGKRLKTTYVRTGDVRVIE